MESFSVAEVGVGVGQMSRRHSFRLNGNGKAPVTRGSRYCVVSALFPPRILNVLSSIKNSYLPLDENEFHCRHVVNVRPDFSRFDYSPILYALFRAIDQTIQN